MSESTPPGGPSPEELARRMAAGSGIHRGEDGQVDVLKTVGGIRGLLESLLPGLVFLVVFTTTQALNPALIGSLVVAAVFTVVRLAQRTPVTQALAGLVGVAICALVSRSTGEAKDYYVVGFYTNVAYGLAMGLSVALRWPLMGLVFGFVRGEGIEWRKDRLRLRAYALATWILVVMFAFRLAVQLPLYYADQVGALGAARLVMGVPLYAMALWIAWSVSRPVAAEGRPEAPAR